ncbi:uncharacterized protein LOC115632001 [Scaptodrosophila lebanonensis]|uniref:COMM domain-containing protein 5 n=1 Tax=Drosophila lebanonensis TaxID=7225 RepID=A0A6J2U9X7_DROLE|nr:uncharacterized protein LOC115632001 [Scaptodrosophila lebanonensis]
MSFKYRALRDIRPYNGCIPQLTKPLLRALIQASVHYLESEKCSPEILDLALNKLYARHEIPKNFCQVFSMVLTTMQSFLRCPKGGVMDHEFREFLKDLKFPDEFIDDLCNVLFNYRATLSRSLAETKIDRPKIIGMQWRINISLATCVAQVSTPTIVLYFNLNNGEHRTLELPLTMFDRLRYNVALLVNGLQSLQNRTALKSF